MLWQRWVTRRSTHCHHARSVRGSPSESVPDEPLFLTKYSFFLIRSNTNYLKKKKKQSPFLFFPIMSWFLCVTRVCISACLTSPITRWVNDGVRQQQILNQQVFVEGASVCSALASDRFGYIRRSGIHSLTTNPIEWLHLNH